MIANAEAEDVQNRSTEKTGMTMDQGAAGGVSDEIESKSQQFADEQISPRIEQAEEVAGDSEEITALKALLEQEKTKNAGLQDR